MATSLSKVQFPFRRKGQTTCIHHQNRKLELYCETCHELACTKCLSSLHKSHAICDLSEITPQKKEYIRNFVDNTEKVDLVQIDQYIASTDVQLKENVSHFEKLSIELQKQTNKLKGDLDLLTAHTLSLYKQIEEDNTKLLQTYKQDLEKYSTQLKQQIEKCNEALQCGSDIQIYDTGHAIQSSAILPVKPTLGIAGFTPNENPLVHLEQALGEVNTSGQIQGQPLQDHDRSVWSSAGQRQSGTRQKSETEGRTPSSQQRSTGRKTLTSPVYTLSPQTKNPESHLEQALGEVYTSCQGQDQALQVHDLSDGSSAEQGSSLTEQNSKGKEEYTLLTRTKVLGEWEAPCSITSVCPTTDDQVWTSDNDRNTLTLLDRKGKVIQEVKHNTEITDISQSPTTNTLWVCDRNSNITEVVSGRLVHRFSTRKIPLCMCITASNNVIVGMTKQISKYTTKGELVPTTSATGVRKRLVFYPYRIAECPVTHNLTVADLKSKRYGYGDEWKPRVVVMDTDFKELFVYDGEVPHTYQPTSQSGGVSFNPRDVVYDSVGNLVIGDHGNNRILLISGRGEFLRIIHTDDYRTLAVGIDTEDVLWAAFGYYRVKQLQYSERERITQCIIL